MIETKEEIRSHTYSAIVRLEECLKVLDDHWPKDDDENEEYFDLVSHYLRKRLQSMKDELLP